MLDLLVMLRIIAMNNSFVAEFAAISTATLYSCVSITRSIREYMIDA